MIRVALAAYLALMSAFGPWACCCAPARLASGLFSPGRPSAPSCCRHKASSAGHAQQAPGRCPGAPQSPSRPACPCKEGQAVEAAVLPAPAEDTTGAPARMVAERLIPAGLPGAGPSLHAGGHAAWPAVAGRPFLSTHDLLCAHHVMRC
jgi:hypothetical protein